MGTPKTVLDRLVHKLIEKGLTERKAKEVVKGVVPVARRVLRGDKPKTLLEKVGAKLLTFSLTERKAKALAKVIAPVVRNAVKKETVKAGEAQVPAEKKDYELREDLPTLGVHGGKAADVLQSMMGLSSGRTYVVVAVKGEEGIVAVRKLYDNCFNVKFYPTMEHWSVTQEGLTGLGAYDYLDRGRSMYQRMHFPKDGFDQLLNRLAATAKTKSKVRKLVDRFKAVTFEHVNKALRRLYGQPAEAVAS